MLKMMLVVLQISKNILEFPQSIEARISMLSHGTTVCHPLKGFEVNRSKRHLDSQVHCRILHNSQAIEMHLSAYRYFFQLWYLYRAEHWLALKI